MPASPAPSDVQAVPANTAIATPAETSTVATTTPQSRAGPQDCTASAGFATTTTTPPSSDHVSQHAHPEPNSQVPYFSSPDFMSLISQGSFSGSYPAIASPLFDHSVFSDPGNVANDIFVPGSAYEALHTALRNRQLWTARPDIPSRGSSPDYETIPGVGVTSTQTSATDTRYKDAQSRAQAQNRPGRGFALSPEREILLWQNYLNEICLWVSVTFSLLHPRKEPAKDAVGYVRQPPPFCFDILSNGKFGTSSTILHLSTVSTTNGAKTE